ncbi:hypothetical protein B0I37DRAFT_421381 [Chaetomium sp. MPI-CAGE-AT-0009]|nr:hypothetical protein B0I37DRAFT_421381 [Chaetomium sp. MPI-CAGE-AT-0009]
MALHVPKKDLSDGEYWFSEEKAADIVRITAYHRRTFQVSVIWFPPSEHLPVRASIAASFDHASSRGLGVLERLPLELLYDVVLRLDMLSIFRLRQTNRRARQVVDGLKEYRIAASHGLDCLRALLHTGLAGDVSLSDFYNALCTESCALCGAFSGFIFLPTWTRCCFTCLGAAPETQLRTLASVQKQFGFTMAELGSLRRFKTLPGIYTPDKVPHESPTEVVSLYQAILLSGQQAELEEAYWSRHYGPRDVGSKYNFMGACALAHYNKRTGEVEHGVSCAGCLHASVWGGGRDRVYAKAGFLQHFKWCGPARELWISSRGGKRIPPLLPRLARRTLEDDSDPDQRL